MMMMTTTTMTVVVDFLVQFPQKQQVLQVYSIHIYQYLNFIPNINITDDILVFNGENKQWVLTDIKSM